MSPPRRNAFAVLSSRSPIKVGYLTYVDTQTPYLEFAPVEASGFRLPAPARFGMENIQERPWKVWEALGIHRTGTDSHLAIRTDVQEAVRNGLRARGVLPGREYIVVHPFSGWEYRSWELRNFNDLVERVISELDHDVVFLCAGDEGRDLESSMRQFAGRSAVRFFHSQDLAESAVVIQDASLFIGNDSGPLHLASALGVRVVGMFGPAPPHLTGPRYREGTYLYRQVECSPCDQRKCIRPHDPCIDLISGDEAFAAVMEGLFRTAAKPSISNA
jgi:ADP-heptose:LPS heptosyltransferase